jgi:hypothetical protein
LFLLCFKEITKFSPHIVITVHVFSTSMVHRFKLPLRITVTAQGGGQEEQRKGKPWLRRAVS